MSAVMSIMKYYDDYHIIIICEAWLKSHGKPCKNSDTKLGLRGWDKGIPGRRDSVSEGVEAGNMLSVALPGRWKW